MCLEGGEDLLLICVVLEYEMGSRKVEEGSAPYREKGWLRDKQYCSLQTFQLIANMLWLDAGYLS